MYELIGLGMMCILVPIFIVAPAWFALFLPAWFGLRQMLGRVDPMAEAMEGVRTSLVDLFADIGVLAETSKSDKLTKMGTRGILDVLAGKGGQVVDDAVLLLARGMQTYREFQDRWAPKLEGVKTLPPRQVILAVHGFWTWLRSEEVAPVLAAAGRCMGLGHDVLKEREVRIKFVIQDHAPSLAHGFWYGLYSVIACQFLMLEAVYALGRPRPLFWVAVGLAAFNIVRFALFLRDIVPYWPVRQELLEIASLAGVPSLPRYAGRLLVGEGLGLLTMLLLVVRFLALGEALQQPGNILSGIHHTIIWILTVPAKMVVKALF